MRAASTSLLVAAALVAVSGRASGEARRPTVAVDFTALDEAAYRRLNALALEQRVLVRLAQEGFAVVVRAGQPQILIRVRLLPDRVIIEDVTGASAAAAAIPPREVSVADEPVPDLAQLEVAQKIVDLARARRATLAVAEASAAAKAASSEGVAPPVPAVSAARGGREIEIGGGGAALWRAGGTDPEARLDVRLGVAGRPVGLRLGAAFAPASGAGVAVYESQLQAGVGYRLRFSTHAALEGALLAGLLAHRYDIADDALRSTAGTRLDLLASAPLTLALFLPGGAFAVELRVAPGVAGGRREHTLGAQTLWQRGALRVEAGLALVLRVAGR